MKKIKILIDADMFAFIACSSAEHEIEWGDDIWTLHCNISEARAVFVDMVDSAIDRALELMQKDVNFKVVFCFSDKDYFRKKVMPTYKANRQGRRKPVCYRALLEWIRKQYAWLSMDNLEADDVIGILATTQQHETLIISGDKDMKCIPGWQYDFIRDEFADVTEEEADKHFLLQALMGDPTDGYSGCPGVGKVTAEKLLDADCSWHTVVSAYKKKGLSEAEALANARCARILRASDYDRDKGEVILWKPPAAR